MRKRFVGKIRMASASEVSEAEVHTSSFYHPQTVLSPSETSRVMTLLYVMSNALYASSLHNPLNLLLFIPVTYLLSLILFPPSPSSPSPLPSAYDSDVYNWLPAKHPEVLLHRKFDTRELSRFDGKDGGRICLAILNIGRDGKVGGSEQRTVFDVSMGRGFYGPGEWTEGS